jgi:hypothetical protein
MMSLLRIIFGVLIGICLFIGIGFLGRHFHTGIPFATADFIGRSIDNCIWLGIGIIGLLYYPSKIRRDIASGILSEATGKSRLQKVRVLCFFSIAVGAFNIYTSLPANFERKYSWQRFSTTDGFASAEFPLSPTKEENVYQDGISSIHISTFVCNLHNKQINLRFTCGQIPSQFLLSTDTQRLEASEVGLQRAGFKMTTFTNDNFGAIPIYRIATDSNDGNAHSIMRVAYQHGYTYHVTATFNRAFQNDPVITRFLDSFQIR